MRKIKLLTLLAALLFSAGMYVQAEIASGTYGTNLTWELTSDGELIVSGTGAMSDMSGSGVPWSDYKNSITSVTIGDGVTSVGKLAFVDYDNITTITIGNDVTTIGDYAFNDCSNATTLTLGNSITNLGKQAFAFSAYTSVTLPNSIQYIGDYAFCNNPLTSITLPKNVVALGQGAFDDCSSLTSITCEATTPPDNLYTSSPAPAMTGDRCFRNVSKNIPVYVPAGTKTTYQQTTGWCDFTNYIEFQPHGTCGDNLTWELTSDGELIITGTGAMSDMSGSGAPWYDYKNSITSVTIGDGVTSVGKLAFVDYDNITTITIGNDVTTIGDYAFNDCTNATTLTLGNSITNLGVQAFAFSAYTSVTLPSSLEHIGKYAFSSNPLTSITIPASVVDLGQGAFDDCSSLMSITCEATTPPSNLYESTPAPAMTGDRCFRNVNKGIPVYVPAGYITTYQQAIGWCDFKNYNPAQPKQDNDSYRGTCGDNLYWVLTSDGALVITGTGAMYNYSYSNRAPWTDNSADITSVSLPSGLTHLGDWSIYQIPNITSVVIPEGVVSLGYVSMAGCNNLESVTLPSTLQTIDNGVFSEDWALQSLTIPAAVTRIGSRLTEGCTSLTSLSVASGNTVYDSHNNCNAIIRKVDNTLIAGCKETVIPNDVLTIGSDAFSSQRTMTSIKIPNSVTTLDEYCFQYCQKLTDLVIPSGVKVIAGSAFAGCKFNTISVNPGNLVYDSRDNCNAIIETATNILVKGCNTTVIPDEIAKIGEGAFWSCWDLKFINLPASVDYIGHNGLIYSNHLEAITCFATVPPAVGPEAFNYGTDGDININPAIPVYVPGASIAAYQAADGWKYFTNFVALDNYYTVKALANHGKVNGTGTYAAGTAITLTPDPDDGFVFEQWSDGTTVSPKNLTVTEDMTIRALFKKDGETEAAPVVAKYVPNVITFNFQPILLAITYKIMIFENGLRVLEIILDENGDIKSTQNVSSAPSRLKARKAKNAIPDVISLELSNLQVGQQYTYTVDTYDASDACISARAGSFEVSGGVVMGDQSTAGDITSILSANNGSEVADLSIIRTIQRNGYFSTLCLPFSMNATQIANSSLAGADIKQFTSAEVADGQLNIAFEPVDEIEAGKPYLIRYSSADALNRLDFSNVTIDADAPEQVNYGNVKMVGTYTPLAVTVTQTSATTGDCLLFLGANNTLYWPNTSGTIKPFRCYFIVSTGSGSAPLRRGMPVRIVEAQNTATNVEAVGGENTNAESIKVIENGVMYIIRNGEKYNAMGQIVK